MHYVQLKKLSLTSGKKSARSIKQYLVVSVLLSVSALIFSPYSFAIQQASSIAGIKTQLGDENTIASALRQLSTKNSPKMPSTETDESTINLSEQNEASNKLLMNIPKKKRTLANQLHQLNHVSNSFSIYSANTKLIDDYDADGYYQTFNLTFDADLLSYSLFNYTDVYADIYLSLNGGPWQHYLTTEIFTLYGESSDDEYSIHTRLNQGYITGEYDVLIDLFEVGYIDIVASYSGFDDAALAAIPLESDEYDTEYIEQVHTDVHYHGGSTSIMLIMLLMLAIVYRQVKKTHKS